ncbi:hypothetical protein HYT17_00400 [Candidatus Microgenomates bacterium]|nr:hypothetical protein [Candidatus Microgenomates bacterium]
MGRRKNFFPTVVAILFSWGSLAYLIYKIPPTDAWIAGFFLLLFLSLFLSASLLFNNTRRGFLVAGGLTVIALLRFFHLFYPLYIILVIALLVTIEVYFLKK